MAVSITSCLKPSFPPSPPPPPPPPSPSPLTKTTLTPLSTSKEVSWRSRCVATAACVIIGSSTAGLAAAAGGGGGAAFAAGDDMKVVKVSEIKVVRWSDRRKCPPWHVNSLENIVPENLPRPPTGPRSDGLVAHKNAPKAGEFSVRYRSSCYSL